MTIVVPKTLGRGAIRACLNMTDEWLFPGNTTFDANGAFALYNTKGFGRGALCERSLQPSFRRSKRVAYRLTPLGKELCHILTEYAA